MNEGKLKELIELVLEEMDLSLQDELTDENTIRVEASARHMHLSREDINRLFGEGYSLTPRRELSQPGQFICEERLTLVGPKGIIENVGIIGPERKKTQVEISKTDARILGVSPPIRDSGDTLGSEDVFLVSKNDVVKAREAVIIAKRHVHMRPKDAEKYGVKDGDLISVEILGERAVTFSKVLVRVNENYDLSMHIDFDEANAINHNPSMRGRIIV